MTFIQALHIANCFFTCFYKLPCPWARAVAFLWMETSTIHLYSCQSSYAIYDQWAQVCNFTMYSSMSNLGLMLLFVYLNFHCVKFFFLCLNGFPRRQNNEYNPHVTKRQRLNSSPHSQINPSLSLSPPRSHRPDIALGESSRSFHFGSSHSFPNPLYCRQPQLLGVAEGFSSLQDYAGDKVYPSDFNLQLAHIGSNIFICFT